MKSLMDGINSGGSRSAAKSSSSNNTIKISIAAVLLLLAAGLMAWNFGLINFSSTEAPPPGPTAQEKQAVDQRAAEIQQKVQQKQVQPAGSN